MNSSEEQSRPAEPPVNSPGTLGSTISRAAGFFGFWLVLTGADAGDLAAGLVAAVTATWASLRLMPAQRWNLRPIKLVQFALHFLRQSIAAGTHTVSLTCPDGPGATRKVTVESGQRTAVTFDPTKN